MPNDRADAHGRTPLAQFPGGAGCKEVIHGASSSSRWTASLLRARRLLVPALLPQPPPLPHLRGLPRCPLTRGRAGSEVAPPHLPTRGRLRRRVYRQRLAFARRKVIRCLVSCRRHCWTCFQTTLMMSFRRSARAKARCALPTSRVSRYVCASPSHCSRLLCDYIVRRFFAPLVVFRFRRTHPVPCLCLCLCSICSGRT